MTLLLSNSSSILNDDCFCLLYLFIDMALSEIEYCSHWSAMHCSKNSILSPECILNEFPPHSQLKYYKRVFSTLSFHYDAMNIFQKINFFITEMRWSIGQPNSWFQNHCFRHWKSILKWKQIILPFLCICCI